MTYGLYTAPVAPTVPTTSFALEAGKDVTIPVTVGSGSLAMKSVAVMLGNDVLVASGVVSLNAEPPALILGADTVDAVLDLYANDNTVLPMTLNVVINGDKENPVEVKLTAPVTP